MKTKKLNALLTGICSSGALLMFAPNVSAASPGEEWDTHNVSLGQPIQTESGNYMGTSLVSGEGQGWDVFSASDGQPITSGDHPYSSYMGTSMGAAPSEDSNAFGAY